MPRGFIRSSAKYYLKNFPKTTLLLELSDNVLVIQLSRLSPSLYPEYSRVFKLMTGNCEDYYYTKVTCATVESLNRGTVRIKSLQGIFTVSFLVCHFCARIVVSRTLDIKKRMIPWNMHHGILKYEMKLCILRKMI